MKSWNFVTPASCLAFWGMSSALVLAAASVACARDNTPVALHGGRNKVVHDPSNIVSCKDEFWLFCTGRGVKSLRSKDLERWEDGPPVFGTFPQWIYDIVPSQRGHFWAPDVIRLRDRYLLYYSVSSWGKNSSAIALASNKTLDPSDASFHWTDEGVVVRTTEKDNFNAIDPNVILDADGKLWMTFGSFWSGIKLVELDAATGKRRDSPVYSLAHSETIEAPYIYPHNGHYYLFVNWGYCSRGTNSTYNIRMGRSEKITGPYLDLEGKDMLQGGGSLFLGSDGSFIGPGHASILNLKGTHWLSCHFYDGERRGTPTLALFSMGWNDQGWPYVTNARTPAVVAPASR
jgi:arabinan endo-1,5-alpha-L-arabinosidase